MGKLYLSFRIKSSWNINGLTLIELLVVIAMVAIMLSFLLLFMNPIKQIDKARNAQRIQNLKQINNALDTYYNDKNYYPPLLSFGNSLQDGSVVYMKKVPQDPSCNAGGACYIYVVDSSTRQWNIIFAKLSSPSVNTSSCALQQCSNWTTSSYAQSGYNYCVLSGKVDCAYINP